MTTRKDLEAKCEELRHLWRAFSTDQNGVCEETPDETFEAGFHACLNLTWPMIEVLKRELEISKAETIAARAKRLSEIRYDLRDENARLKAEVEELKRIVEFIDESITTLRQTIAQERSKLKVYEEALDEAKWFCQDQRARANEAINTICPNEGCDYQCSACIRSIDDCEDLVLKINKALEQAKEMK